MKNHNLLSLLFLFGLLVCCGEKKEKAEKEESIEIALPEEKNEVTTMSLEISDFYHEMVSNGKLNARRKADLRFQSSEAIATIYVKNGDRVVKGQKIAELDPFRLEQKRAQANDALERAKLSLQDVLIGQGYLFEDSANIPETTMQLAKIKSSYDNALIQYNIAEYEEKHAILTAPFDGVIANLTAKEFNNANTAEAFCSVIDPKSLEASFSILESELPMIKVGNKVSVVPYATPDKSQEGRITEINPLVDDNGMVKVKAAVSGQGSLFEGMNVRVSIQQTIPNQWVVPKTAVVLRSGKQVIFKLANGKALWEYVTTGLENTTHYTLVEATGLQLGDVIITSGNINLAHEAPVTIVRETENEEENNDK